MHPTLLEVDDAGAAAGIRRGRLRLPDGRTREFGFESHAGALSDSSADPMLMVALMPAMRHGGTLRVRGRVTCRLLVNLDEWQSAWCMWKPDVYSPVTIEADEILSEEAPSTGRAIAAFSGGVDAAYTALRPRRPGAASLTRITSALLVHGFEIPLGDPGAFARARDRAALMLADTDIQLLTVAADVKGLGLDWNDAFGICVAAALQLHAPQHGVGVIGSSEPYDHLVLPWGSNPVTDHLLSSGHMEIRHDGAGASRSRKVRALSERPEITRHLRVCFTADSRDRNCGRCEKCIRTTLNFLASGVPVPANCFDHNPTVREVAAVHLTTPAVIAEWQTLVAEARRHRINDPWVRAAEGAVRRGQMRLRLLTRGSKVKRALRPSRAS